MTKTKDIKVYLIQSEKDLNPFVEKILDSLLPINPSDKNILIKPNLLKAGERLAVTSPWLIKTVAKFFKNKGSKVIVADSPAFGTASNVLKFLAIHDELKDMGIKICTLAHPQALSILDKKISISKQAIESDLIINLPRLKAHCQMGITCGVKNLYGTVVGFRKALYHMLYGTDRSMFSRIIIEIIKNLPPVLTIVDASVSMHRKGPTKGSPIRLNIIAGSNNPFAVDTCIYHIIKATPALIPLWQEAINLGIKGANIEDISFPLLRPEETVLKNSFEIPYPLEPIRFNPFRFVKGRIKSVIKKLP